MKNRKKQGSLFKQRGRKHYSERSLDTIREGIKIREREHVVQKPFGGEMMVDDVIKFIEHYHLVKLQYEKGNITTKNIYQQSFIGHSISQQQQQQENDQQFQFDVDLGVPYVQSHHLDSGFEYEEKANQQQRMQQFPKVSSAKQIFTSVLQLDNNNTQNNNNISEQLQQENFTDQQDESESSFCMKKSAAFKKRSRKQVTIVDKQQQDEGNNKYEKQQEQYVQQNVMMENTYNKRKVYQGNSQIMGNRYNVNSMCSSIEKQSIVERLKSTVLSRQNKLQYWNQRLIELESSHTNVSNHSQIIITQKRLNPSPSSSSKQSSSNNRKSKCEKVIKKNIPPTITTTKLVELKPNNNHSVYNNKQNITPSSSTYSAKLKSVQLLQTKSSDKSNSHNNNISCANQHTLLLNKLQSNLKYPSHNKNIKNNYLSKDRSIVKKIF